MTNRISKIATSLLMIFSIVIINQSVANKFCDTLPEPIDLSYVTNEQTENWVADFKFRLTDQVRQNQPNGDFYALNNFVGAEHGGTHIDAPYHFNEKGIKVSEIPLTKLITAGKHEPLFPLCTSLLQIVTKFRSFRNNDRCARISQR